MRDSHAAIRRIVQLGALVVLICVALAVRGNEDLPKRALDAWFEAAELSAKNCTGDDPERAVVMFMGLVDLASQDPKPGGNYAYQAKARVSLVRHYERVTRDEVTDMSHCPVIFIPETACGDGASCPPTDYRWCASGYRCVSLRGEDLTIRDLGSAGTVKMHRHMIDRSVDPSWADPESYCSLRWVPLGDDLVPDRELKGRVFRTHLVQNRAVASSVTVGEGEMFNSGFYYDKNDQLLRCKLDDVETPVSSDFTAAFQIAAGRLVLNRGPILEAWALEAPADQRPLVLVVANLPCNLRPGDHYYLHLKLRENRQPAKSAPWGPLDCKPTLQPGARSLYFFGDPQCSPMDNQYP